jgi:group I intron endonuclease
MFVYVIVNSETLKIYVGQHKGTNLRQYLQQKMYEAKRGISTRSHLYASMRIHPHGVWSIYPLFSDLQTKEDCDYWERLLIKSLNTQNPEVGYNICRGGEGHTGVPWNKGKKMTLAAREKMRISALGNHNRKGKKASPETREKISKAGVGRKHSDATRWGMKVRLTGTKRSEETKRKISAALMGHAVSEKTKQKIRIRLLKQH